MEQLGNQIWNVESLRLTSFLKNDFNNSLLENWLKEISKNEPLSINKSINYFQGLVQINSSMLKLEWNNNRIDLFLSSNAPPIESNIGTSNDIERLMHDILLGFFDINDCPVSRRLAIGIILNIPVKDYDEGVDVIQPKLKSVSNIKGTTDFLFRINKPVQSKMMSELKLNRLMTWSIGYLQILKIPFIISQQNIVQQNVQQDSKSEMICRLEMDFNTVESGEIGMSADNQKSITIELLNEAMKVVEKGEFGIEL
jgi:hypothetical protein